jgi:RND family efflux transporter MFP subunit
MNTVLQKSWSPMKKHRPFVALVVLTLALAAPVLWVSLTADDAPSEVSPAVAKPALTVTVTNLRPATLPIRISAHGNIAAWQEASIGTEANGLRLADVRVNVGDVVRRGQVLATFDSDTVTADLAHSRAAVAEAEAALAEARDNAQRALTLTSTGAMSEQQILQYMTAEMTAQARLAAMQALETTQQLRLTQAAVLAPDDGVISSRSATLGAVLPAGEELFRLIRRGRLEWRAEVAAPDLARLRPGLVAHVTPVGGEAIQGTLRMVAPTVDTQTRTGLVYVDLPPGAPALAGMFATGEFEIGAVTRMTLPQSAVLLRDGFRYVMRVGADSRVLLTKVTVGTRVANRVEILDGLDKSARVVVSGGAFLGDGDLVRVVEEPAAPVPGGEAR